MPDIAGWVAGVAFLVGLAAALGKLSARVDNLEDWRHEVRDDIKAIRATTDSINGAIRNGRN